jgi:hypothetical protein
VRTVPARLKGLRAQLAEALKVDYGRPTAEQRGWARKLLFGQAGDESETALLGIAEPIRIAQMDIGRFFGELVVAGADDAVIAEVDELECQAFAAWHHRIRFYAGLEATP